MTRRTLTTAVLAILAMLALAASALGARPATTQEARVIMDAANHLTANGAPTPMPPVIVEDTPGERCTVPDPTTGQDYAADACVEWDGTIVLSPTAAKASITYAWLTTRRAGRTRRSSLTWCRNVCVPIMATALHELVHTDRIRVNGGSWPDTQRNREEGLAEAVAQDQACPFVWRATSSHDCATGYGYPTQVDALRAESARTNGTPWQSYQARRWRLNQLTRQGSAYGTTT